MPSSAWSRRRYTLRRPAVCHDSRDPDSPDEELLPDISVSAFTEWAYSDTPYESNSFVDRSCLRIPGTNLWSISGWDNLDQPLVGVFHMARFPGLSVIELTLLLSPDRIMVITGVTDGWDGTEEWESLDAPLEANWPFFEGHWHVNVPSLAD